MTMCFSSRLDSPRLYLYDTDGTVKLQKLLDEPMFNSRLYFKEREWLVYRHQPA